MSPTRIITAAISALVALSSCTVDASDPGARALVARNVWADQPQEWRDRMCANWNIDPKATEESIERQMIGAGLAQSDVTVLISILYTDC